MSVDKLVDSTQLDADLTSVANAIRTKGGTSADLAFPAGFVSAINAISGGGGGSEVPDGYVQLDYIASDGAAWINTGEYRQSGDVIEFYGGLLRKAGSTGYFHPFGTSNFFLQATGFSVPTASANVKLNSSTYAGGRTFHTYPCHSVVGNTTYDQYAIQGTSWNVATQSSGTVSTDTIPLALFARNKGSTVDYIANGYAIFRFKWTRNSAVIHEYIPAMRVSDGEIGLYDKAENTFVTNAAGSGAFKGATRE